MVRVLIGLLKSFSLFVIFTHFLMVTFQFVHCSQFVDSIYIVVKEEIERNLPSFQVDCVDGHTKSVKKMLSIEENFFHNQKRQNCWATNVQVLNTFFQSCVHRQILFHIYENYSWTTWWILDFLKIW